MASYLAEKSEALASQTPVEPAKAQAAQILLQNFTVPTFPPEAFTAGLEHLTLTSDIPISEYTEALKQEFTIPELPPTIKSLSLELFSLGYAPGFLTLLSQRLPGLTSLTIYSQILSGTNIDTISDALDFFKAQSVLKELHLIDVFAPPLFFTALAPILSAASSLKFLEISFTSRDDAEFIGRLNAAELFALVKDGLVGLTLSIATSENVNGDEVEMKLVDEDATKKMVERLANGKGLEKLVMLDLTMFELDLIEVEQILDGNAGLKVVGFAVRGDWKVLLENLSKKERGIEVLEIVGVGTDMDTSELIGERLLDGLSKTWNGLRIVKASFLKRKAEQWLRESEEEDWKKQA